MPEEMPSNKLNDTKAEELMAKFKEKLEQDVIFVAKVRLDDSIWSHWDIDLGNFLETYHKKFGKDSIKEFKIMVKEYHIKPKPKTISEKKTEFEMTADLFTDRGDFYAKKSGWNPVIVFHEMVEALRRQVLSE